MSNKISSIELYGLFVIDRVPFVLIYILFFPLNQCYQNYRAETYLLIVRTAIDFIPGVPNTLIVCICLSLLITIINHINQSKNQTLHFTSLHSSYTG